MKLILHVILLFLIASFECIDAKKKIRCHNAAIDNCFKHFFGIGKRPDSTKLATTEDGLNIFCGAFNKTMDCVNKQLKKCGTPLAQEMWDLMTGEMQYRFREQICFDTPLRQNYLKHGQCIYDHVIGVDDAIPCLNNYLLAFEHLATNVTHDWHATLCCAHTRKERCTDALARDHCGPEAEEAFRVFFDKIHFGVFSTSCYAPVFDIDTEVCKKALPNAGTKPKANKSNSYVSKLLYKNFPFNYIPLAFRNKKKN